MVKFIADPGSNHNQSFERLMVLCKTAKKIGCWGVKPQIFKVAQLGRGTAIPEEWEFNLNWLPDLKELCDKLELKLGFSVFYEDAVDKIKDIADFIKISSFDALRLDLVKKASNAGLPLFISTGLIYDKELDFLKENVDAVFFHCVSKYPVPVKEANLWRIRRKKLEGYSDHSCYDGVIYKAIALGANHIEFHIDVDGYGWETKVSRHVWKPGAMKDIITNIKVGEEAVQNCLFPEEYFKQRAK